MKKYFTVISILYVVCASAQNDRYSDFNNINWLQQVTTIHLNKKWALHGEYQWRRTDGLKYWQQSLVRIGLNRKLNDAVALQAGYAWSETFAYGDFPIAAMGTFPEHRFYQQLVLRQPAGRITMTHRFRTEQRWLGQVITTGGRREVGSWSFVHRFRYQLRAAYALSDRLEKQPYLVAADEIFIGAGKKVGVNIFDQNRLFLLAGYKFSNTFSLEAGYINQTLQQGKRVNNATIMQRNNGILLAGYLTF